MVDFPWRNGEIAHVHSEFTPRECTRRLETTGKMSSIRYKDWILETIDQLRKRKARPDRERICHMVERKHGLSFEEIGSNLEKLVDECIVIKVEYKGSTSYRNAAKWKKSNVGGQVLNSNDVSRKIHDAIRALTEGVDSPNSEKSAGEAASSVSEELSAARSSPVSAEDIEMWLLDQDPETNLIEGQLIGAINREVEAGRLEKLQDDTYRRIPKIKRQLKRKEEGSAPSTPQSAVEDAEESAPGVVGNVEEAASAGTAGDVTQDNGELDPSPEKTPNANPDPPLEISTHEDEEMKSAQPDDAPNPGYVKAKTGGAPRRTYKSGAKSGSKSVTSPGSGRRGGPSGSTSGGTKLSPGRKGRPTTKRKKFKKSLGPEFESYSLVKKRRRDSYDKLSPSDGVHDPALKCDYCLQTSEQNRKGLPEHLLVCKDCSAKAHPSCMDYSEQLAKRAQNSPWQCIDCKTCYICQDAGDPDAMLFCDACDKGYHMTCHDPPVEDKPTGKWVCSKCMLELDLKDEEEEDEEEEQEQQEDLEAGQRQQEEPMNTDELLQPKTEQPTDFSHDTGPSFLPTPSDSPVQFQDDTKDSSLLNGNVATPIPKLANNLKTEIPDASDWTIEDVVSYFKGVGFIDQSEVFREQEIDGKSLLLMKRSDVLTGLSLKLGPALKMYAHVQRLQTQGQMVF